MKQKLRKLIAMLKPRKNLVLRDYFQEGEHVVNARVYEEDGRIATPADETLASLEDFLLREKVFLTQMRSLGCQIALSSRLVDLLKERGHPGIEDVLVSVPIINKRAFDPKGQISDFLIVNYSSPDKGGAEIKIR